MKNEKLKIKDLVFQEINKKEYEAFCSGKDIPLTQQYFYGEWHRTIGKKVWRYVITWEPSSQVEEVVGFFQIIRYPGNFGRSYLYIPHGPVFIKKVSHTFVLFSTLRRSEAVVKTRNLSSEEVRENATKKIRLSTVNLNAQSCLFFRLGTAGEESG